MKQSWPSFVSGSSIVSPHDRAATASRQSAVACSLAAMSVIASPSPISWSRRTRRRLRPRRCQSRGFARKAAEQRKILLVPIWREVQMRRHMEEFLLLNGLLVFFHEALIDPPGDARSLYGIALRSHRDLVGMQVMQTQ